MQSSPRNKMIGSEIQKAQPKKILRRFFFPHLGISIEAETREEAEQLAASRTNQ